MVLVPSIIHGKGLYYRDTKNNLGDRRMDIEQRYEKLINYLTDYIYTVTIKDGVVVDTFHGPAASP